MQGDVSNAARLAWIGAAALAVFVAGIVRLCCRISSSPLLASEQDPVLLNCCPEKAPSSPVHLASAFAEYRYGDSSHPVPDFRPIAALDSVPAAGLSDPASDGRYLARQMRLISAAPGLANSDAAC